MPQAPAGKVERRAQQASPEWHISQAIATAFVYLEALDRSTLSSMTPPLTPPQYHAMVALEALPEQSLGELAQRLLCDKANASGIVDRLEALGLVNRVRTPSDRRRVSLTLTSAGTKALEEATRRREGSLSSAFEQIAADDMASMRDALVRLADALAATYLHGANTR